MLQSMLEDRFKLVVHTEQREMRFRALVLSKADGRLGPYMKRMETCTPEALAEARKQFPPRPAHLAASGEGISGSCSDLLFMELSLTQWSDVPVLDKTGLSGRFTYDLRFVSNQDSAGGRRLPTEVVDAMEEQLGLTLRVQQGPMAVMVVEAIARPTEN